MMQSCRPRFIVKRYTRLKLTLSNTITYRIPFHKGQILVSLVTCWNMVQGENEKGNAKLVLHHWMKFLMLTGLQRIT
jgi:hypothetical protein